MVLASNDHVIAKPQKGVGFLKGRTPAGLVRAVYRRLFPRRVPPHPFDLQHGTDTGGLLPTQKTGHVHGTSYWGTAPSLMRGALARWAATLDGTSHSPADYTFIDLGCGKGRALMLASETAFGRVVGVELDAALVATARANLALWSRSAHACNQLEVLHQDALAMSLPDTPVALYLYNPFDEHLIGILAERLTALQATRSHPIDVMYCRPEHAAFIEAMPGVRTLWKGEVPYTAEDTAADVFDTVQQQCFLYRLQGHAGGL